MRYFYTFLFILLITSVSLALDFGGAIERLIKRDDVDTSLVRIVGFPRELPQGYIIGSWVTQRTGVPHIVPVDCYFFLVDDYPLANWEHPCRYFYVSEEGIEFTQENSPPDLIDGMIVVVSKEIDRDDVARRSVEYAAPREPAELDHCWAVLISGGGSPGSNYPRYWNDIQFIYLTLMSYGYHDDHIIVLVSDGTNPANDRSDGSNSEPDLDDDGDDDIGYSATIANLELVFGMLESTLTPADQLFIFSTDHGSQVSGWTAQLVLWDENIVDSSFATLLEPLECRNMIITMEQCYSGGFIDDLEDTNRVIATACRWDQVSYGGTYYDEFVFDWISAVNWADPYGTPVDADIDMDMRISMDEAFIYAEANDEMSEDPQYSSIPGDFGTFTFIDGFVPGQPYPIWDGTTFSEISGDGDDVLDSGEFISMFPHILNVGDTAYGVDLRLRSSEGEITIVDSIVDIGTLFPLDTTWWDTDHFDFEISASASLGDSFLVTVHFEDDSSYIEDFDIYLHIPEPSLIISDITIDDITGDMDGYIDPGETADLYITIANTGQQEAESVTGELVSFTPSATVGGTSNYGEISAGDNSSGTPFTLTLSGSAEPYSIIELDLILSYSSSYVETLYVSFQASGAYTYPATEDPSLWATSGWTITEHRSSESESSWYSGSSYDFTYPNSSNIVLETNYPVAIPDPGVLFYSEFSAMEERYDYVNVEYSPDGISWSELAVYSDYDPPWRGRVIDLGEIFENAAYFRFRLDSDGGVNAEGWYLDEISIEPRPATKLFCGYVIEPVIMDGVPAHFRICYYNRDGLVPSLAQVVVDGSPYAMTSISGSSQTGRMLGAEIELLPGEHNFYFLVDDVHYPEGGEITGPRVVCPTDTFDIASSDYGFTHSGTVDDWSWGLPTSEPSSGMPYSGFVWATNPGGDYSSNSACRLESPYIDLSTYEHPYLLVNQWYRSDVGFSPLHGAGNVKISNGSDEIVLAPMAGYDGTISSHNVFVQWEQGFGSQGIGDHWHCELFDLNTSLGDNISVLFDWGDSDSYSSNFGWYLSNIYVLDNAPLSIGEEKLPNKIDLYAYPNPFNSTMVIVAPKGAKIEIFDISGRCVKAELLSDLSPYIWRPGELHGSGIYLVRATSENESLMKRVVYLK